jgi:hypothetical protein
MMHDSSSVSRLCSGLVRSKACRLSAPTEKVRWGEGIEVSWPKRKIFCFEMKMSTVTIDYNYEARLGTLDDKLAGLGADVVRRRDVALLTFSTLNEETNPSLIFTELKRGSQHYHFADRRGRGSARPAEGSCNF